MFPVGIFVPLIIPDENRSFWCNSQNTRKSRFWVILVPDPTFSEEQNGFEGFLEVRNHLISFRPHRFGRKSYWEDSGGRRGRFGKIKEGGTLKSRKSRIFGVFARLSIL